MRIKNKYQRNRLAKQKAWNRAKKLVGGEFTQKWFNPYWVFGLIRNSSVEEQIQDHQTWIKNRWVYTFLNGNKSKKYHAPKFLKKTIEHSERHRVKASICQMMKHIEDVEDYEIPLFKHQADWDWQ